MNYGLIEGEDVNDHFVHLDKKVELGYGIKKILRRFMCDYSAY